MTEATNLEELKRLHQRATARGAGSSEWTEFSAAMVDAFPALHDMVKGMNDDLERLRRENADLKEILAGEPEH